MSNEGFRDLVNEIMRLGYNEETAADYAARIGDTPGFDESGYVVVRGDNGQVLVRLKLKSFEE